jgi:hypothetical protein
MLHYCSIPTGKRSWSISSALAVAGVWTTFSAPSSNTISPFSSIPELHSDRISDHIWFLQMRSRIFCGSTFSPKSRIWPKPNIDSAGELTKPAFPWWETAMRHQGFQVLLSSSPAESVCHLHSSYPQSRERRQRLAGGQAPRSLGESVVRLERQRFCTRLSRHGRRRVLSSTYTRRPPGLTREFLAGYCGCQP